MEHLAVGTVVGLILFVFVVLVYFPVGLYISAVFSGVAVSPWRLIGQRLRGIDQGDIIRPLIQGKKAGLRLDIEELEAHYMANGRVGSVVNAMISANKAGISLLFNQAAAIDLAGRNILEAVAMSVNPRVIKTPLLAGVAKNGIEVKAMARVTVKAHIDRLVGGAGEETILARVGEGICAAIGSVESHKEILEYPDRISKTIIKKGLDANTAFEIVSVDIADVEVGRNIGANLQIEQAEADKRIAQAKAEERRVMAVARTQEMQALEQEMKAKLVEAQADVPRAMAEALLKGNLGVMDYYKMKNVDADTRMRENFSQYGTDQHADASTVQLAQGSPSQSR